MREPKDTPDRGDRCFLRGNPNAVGVLLKYDPESNWCTVTWDEGVKGPITCHRFELRKLGMG
jgi:hypothetical protein